MGGHIRRIWNGTNGVPQLEAISIAGMGHGEPLGDTSADGCGVPGAFFVDVGISAAREIVRFWKLDGASLNRWAPKTSVARQRAIPQATAQIAAGSPPARSPFCPDAVIAAAFKAAGLTPLPTKPEGSHRIDPDAIIDAALKGAGLRR